MDLVILLIQSIKKEHSTKKTVDDLYSIFSDDPIYDGEFFEVIREGRNAHREIVEL